MAVTRLVTLDDAERLASLVTASREYLAPWEPVQDEGYYTAAGQRSLLEKALATQAEGQMLPLVVLDRDGQVCGRLNVNNIVRGAFQNGSLGYWVGEGSRGRGLASAAVAEAVEAAFGPLGLHRLEAGTLLHNTASQRVLTRNGFRPFAVAEKYVKIAGEWQDHILFQRLSASAS